MARLDDLPSETLLQMLSYLTKNRPTERFYGKSDLYNTALVSHRLSDLTRQILVRKIIFDIDIKPFRGDSFVRSVQENPAIGLMVQELDLQWNQGNYSLKTAQGAQDDHSKVNLLLTKLCNLKVLNITAHHLIISFEPTFLDSMKYLSHLTIRDSSLTISSMSLYMFHDSLRSLDIGWVEERDVLPILPPRYTSGTSSLLHLTLSASFHVTEEVLSEILRWPRALESLSCGQTGRELPFRKILRNMEWQEPTTPFSPAAMSRALESTRHSLKRLCVFNSYVHKGPHDGSRLRLDMMEELREVDAQMAWFFRSFEEREHFYKLLPPKLEVLKLCLGGLGHGVTRSEVEDDNGEEEEPRPSPDLLWLTNIVSNKSEYFPLLKEIHLKECVNIQHNMNGNGTPYCGRHWVPPRVVARALQEANILLVAIVYKKDPDRREKYKPGLFSVGT